MSLWLIGTIAGESMPLYRRSANGPFWVRIGRKTRQSTGTTNRALAEEFERVLTERLWRREKLGDRGAISWNEVAERWLADSRRGRTRDREFLKWLKPKIGQDMVSAIADPDTLERLRRDGLSVGWSHSTVDRMLRTVRAVLRACIRWGYLDAVPHVPMYGETQIEPRSLTPMQFAKLCRELPPHLDVAARFAVLTLLRMRAQSQLTWDRVDLRRKCAWVPSSQMKGGKTFGFTLSAEALKVLRECRRMNPPNGERVFQYHGRPVDDFNTAAFQKAVRRAGVHPLRWHDLRHTGASWAVQNGVSLQALVVMGDWRSYSMVLRYAHLAPAHATSAAKRVGTSVAQALKLREGRSNV